MTLFNTVGESVLNRHVRRVKVWCRTTGSRGNNGRLIFHSKSMMYKWRRC